jgi:hypothetical protein
VLNGRYSRTNQCCSCLTSTSKSELKPHNKLWLAVTVVTMSKCTRAAKGSSLLSCHHTNRFCCSHRTMPIVSPRVLNCIRTKLSISVDNITTVLKCNFRTEMELTTKHTLSFLGQVKRNDHEALAILTVLKYRVRFHTFSMEFLNYCKHKDRKINNVVTGNSFMA